MSFEEVAKSVIKDSIRSAICIDDEYPSAYQEDELPKRSEAISLYNSFRDDGNCDLDIYNFKSISDSWNKDYMLHNKDLMILDWQLIKEGPENLKYKPTIEILEDVISSNKIPFVVIYTNTEDLLLLSSEINK